MSAKNFNYAVNSSNSWPPMVRPKPPFGPTSVEVMRSCSLRSCFEVSPGYERRTSVSGRIGTVLHATIQHISESPLATKTTEQVIAAAVDKFTYELKVQRAKAMERPRELSLPWDNHRAERALEAAIAESIRIFQTGNFHEVKRHGLTDNSETNVIEIRGKIDLPFAHGNSIAVEVPVHSLDGKFKGRVDRAEQTLNGTRLIDYKSALREDIPERYERQLQLYSFMWHDTYGDWPTEAKVHYPLSGASFNVDISPSICQQAALEAATLIAKLEADLSPSKLATPGDVCKVCDFRAWCRPFWALQAKEEKHLRALERAFAGFEGSIDSINLANHYWHISISWRNAKIKLTAPQERFPHLISARPGQTLRILDAKLRGQIYEPIAHISEYTEIFVLGA